MAFGVSLSAAGRRPAAAILGLTCHIAHIAASAESTELPMAWTVRASPGRLTAPIPCNKVCDLLRKFFELG